MMKLKEEFLKLLREDLEFRYAVAGLIGLEEILRRLDGHEEALRRLWEEVAKLREDMAKGFGRHDVEFTRLREDMVKGFKQHSKMLEIHAKEMAKLRKDMVEGFKRHDAELARLREDMVKGFERHDTILERHSEQLAKLREDMVKGFERHDRILEKHSEELAKLREDLNRGFERHDLELAKLREDMLKGFERYDRELTKLREDMVKGFERHDRILEKHGAELARLREDFNRMLKLIGRMDIRLSRVERTLEKLTLDIEEEAREVLMGRLRRMGYEVELRRLELPELEVNVYGVLNDLCVIGEATVRLGARAVEELIDKVELLSRLYPDRLRPKRVLVAYTSLATDEALEEARRRGVWVLKASADLTPPPSL